MLKASQKQVVQEAKGKAPPLPTPVISGVVVGEVDVHTVSLAWSAATSNNGSPIEDGIKREVRYVIDMAPCVYDKSGTVPLPQKFGNIYNGPDLSCIAKDLSPGKPYAFRGKVEATQAKQGPWTKVVVAKTKQTTPKEPRNFTIMTKKRNNLILKWAGPECDGGAAVKEYVMLWDEGKVDLKDNQFVVVYKGSDKKFKVDKNMSPGSPYRFRIYAVNEIGSGEQTETKTFRTAAGPPNRPSPVYIIDCDASTLELGWHTPEGNGAEVAEYTLEMDKSHEGYGYQNIYTGPDTRFTVTGLKRCTGYTFRVSARNAQGTSKPSDTAKHTTGAEAPSAPPSPGLVDESLNSIRLAFENPIDTGGSDIRSFVLQMDNGTMATAKKFNVSGKFFDVYRGPLTDVTIPNLLPGTVYQCRLSCSNKIGSSPFSKAVLVGTNPERPGPPSSPSVQAVAGCSNQIRVQWMPPQILGGAHIDKYSLQMRKINENPPPPWKTVFVGPALEYTASGLAPGVSYEFRVSATNKAGESEYSEGGSAESNADKPSSPREFTVENITATSLVLKWKQADGNGSPVTEYVVFSGTTPKSNSKEMSQFTQVYAGLQLTTTINNVAPATEYSFQVQAKNKVGPGPATPTITARTLCAAPEQPSPPRVIQTEGSTAQIKWQKPLTNGEPITSYSIQIEGMATRLPVEECEDLTYMIVDMVPKQKYKVRLQATNKMGDSLFSRSATVSSGAIPPPQPRLELVTPTSKTLKLRWKFPKGMDAISSIVEQQNWWGGFDVVYTGTQTTCKVLKLAPNKSYVFRACGVNEAGQGLFGPPGQFSTVAEAIPTADTPEFNILNENDEKDPNVDIQLGLPTEFADVQKLVVELQLRCAKDGVDEHDVILSAGDNNNTITVSNKLSTVYIGRDTTLVIKSGLIAGASYEGRMRFCLENADNQSKEDILGTSVGAYSATVSFHYGEKEQDVIEEEDDDDDVDEKVETEKVIKEENKKVATKKKDDLDLVSIYKSTNVFLAQYDLDLLTVVIGIIAIIIVALIFIL
eukprot:m.65573 g.65573  ORF g.65573 m.65573 type:complete len:1035 (-) comp11744_c0_seq2:74-3178(-)